MDIKEKIKKLEKEQKEVIEQISVLGEKSERINVQLERLYESLSSLHERDEKKCLKKQEEDKAIADFNNPETMKELLFAYNSYSYYRRDNLITGKPINLCYKWSGRLRGGFKKYYWIKLIELFIEAGYMVKDKHLRGEWQVKLNLTKSEIEQQFDTPQERHDFLFENIINQKHK